MHELTCSNDILLHMIFLFAHDTSPFGIDSSFKFVVAYLMLSDNYTLSDFCALRLVASP